MKTTRLWLIALFCAVSPPIFAQLSIPYAITGAGAINTSGGQQLNWTLGETMVLNLTSGSVGLNPGIQQVTITEGTTAVHPDHADLGLVAYPNPATDKLSVRSQYAITEWQVLSLSGQDLSATTPASLSSADLSLDVRGLASGVYLLNITANGASQAVRFVKP